MVALTDDVVDAVGTALGTDLLVAGRRATAAELIGEDDLVRPLVERGGVPEREVHVVLHPVDDLRVLRVLDGEEQTVTHAGTCGQVLGRQHGDVVATGGLGDARVGGTARVPAVREEDREVHDAGFLGCLARHLDDGYPVVRRLAVGEGLARRVRGDVHVDVVALGNQRVGVRSARGLDGGDVLRIALVADVEDLHALPGRLLRGGLGGAGARVVAARGVRGEEQQVPGDGNVVLRSGTQHLGDRARCLRIADVEDPEAVVVSGEGVLPLEGQVRVQPLEGILGDIGEVGDVAAVDDLVHAGYLTARDRGGRLRLLTRGEFGSARGRVTWVGCRGRGPGHQQSGEEPGGGCRHAQTSAPHRGGVQRGHCVLPWIRM